MNTEKHIEKMDVVVLEDAPLHDYEEHLRDFKDFHGKHPPKKGHDERLRHY